MTPRGGPELRQLRTRILVAALLAVIVAGALAWQVISLHEQVEGAVRSGMTVSRAHEVARLAVEHENAVRGHLLTGDREFIEEFAAAETALGPAIDSLQQLVSEDPEQVARAGRLRQLVQSWRTRAADALLHSTSGEDVGLAEGMTERRPIMDDVRAEAQALAAAEQERWTANARRARRASNIALVSALVLSLVLGAILTRIVVDRARRLRADADRVARRAQTRTEQLTESEERFRLFVEGVRDAAIYMLDPQGRVRSWNIGAERIKGYAPDEIIGRHFSIFYTPEDVAAGAPDRDLAQAAERPQFDAESWRVRKDGSRFWAAVTLRALRGVDGGVVGYAKLIRDNTERKRVEMRRDVQYRVARVLSEATSPSAALEPLLATVAETLGYDAALAWEADGGQLRVRALWTGSPGASAFLESMRGERLPRGEGVPGRVWSSGRARWLEDVRDHLGSVSARRTMEAGLLSILAFPIPIRGKPSLVLELFAADPRERDGDLMQLSTTLGLQIGAYLERERSQDEAREVERRRGEDLERRLHALTAQVATLTRELEAADSAVARERVDLTALFREAAQEVRERDPAQPLEIAVEEGLEARGDGRLLRLALVNLVAAAAEVPPGAAPRRVELRAEPSPPGNGSVAGRAFRVQVEGVQALARTSPGISAATRILRRHGGSFWAVEEEPGNRATFRFTVDDG